MKTHQLFKYVVIPVGYLIFSTGCSDFLERSSSDLIIPEHAEDFKELLQGEAYFKELFEKSAFAIYMTDDVEYRNDDEQSWSSVSHSDLFIYQDAYGWAPEVENDRLADACFSYLYTQILTANICLTALDKMKGTTQEKKILEGQACFTRAFAYFLLANFYARAYNEADADDPCVPLVLEPDPTMDKPLPATIETIWNRIDKDITQALVCLKHEPETSIYEIGYMASLVLATRIALFKENYEAVISYGEELLGFNSRLYDITLLPSDKEENDESDRSFMNPFNNPEIIWMFDNGKKASYTRQLRLSVYREYFTISTQSTGALLPLFTYDEKSGEGDKRLPLWFNPPGMLTFGWEPVKYDSYAVDYKHQNAFRTAEIYLSLAEAHARKNSPDTEKVLYYLNVLRSHRIIPYTPLENSDFSNFTTLIDFIWEERRRELCMEEHHRWWDLRRCGRPALTHVWKNGAVFSLEKGGSAYVLTYPRYEREYNP
ncbi:MAG: RagB/SusD family nutrient uptake outer membrane protein [Tannerella sp.]|jgi:hypothetical protein|nr:RagB/SusD family nutrient uptake outer membrane protein [Tannerella sp.]